MKELLERFNTDIGKDSIWMHASPGAAAREAFLCVQEAGWFKCLPDYYTERENLDSFLILYTISGSGALEIEGRVWPVGIGQSFFIDCMQHHRYRTVGQEIWETCWVHVRGGGVRAYHELYRKSCPPVVTVKEGDIIREALQEIVQRHLHFDRETELLCANRIHILLTELLRSADSGLIQPAAMPDSIRIVLNKLQRNLSGRITLDDLSHEAALSKYHLERQFRKHTGVTIHEFHIRLRIQAARELLTGTDMPVCDIARMVGVEHVSHFIRLFRERVHDTPGEYRKRWRQLG